MDITSQTQVALIPLISVLMTTILYFFVSRILIARNVGIDITHEIATNDNFAYSLSYASSLFGFALTLSPLVKTIPLTLPISIYITYTAIYGVLVMLLLELGRFIHDKYILHRFDESKAIGQKNMAGAIVDSMSIIANTIIISALAYIFLIIKDNTDTSIARSIFLIASVYLGSQMLLFIISRCREYLYAKNNQGFSFQFALRHENNAIALRHGGFMITAALIFKVSVTVVPTQIQESVDYVIMIGAVTFVLSALTFLLSYLLNTLVLLRINHHAEIDQQDNIGIAFIQLAILLGLAFALLALYT